MKTITKWIMAAIIMMVTGALICGAAFAVLGFNFHKLSTAELETNTYEVKEDFQNITVKADIENITFLPSNDGTCKVICLEEKEYPHQVSVQGDTLTIGENDSQKLQFFNYAVITESPKIEIYLPKDTYQALSADASTGNVDISKDFTFDCISVSLDTGNIDCQASADGDVSMKTDTGHIVVSGVSASTMSLTSDTGRMDIANAEISGDMEIREDTGKVNMENVTCRNLTSDGDTGSLVMTKVLAAGEFKIKRSTGKVEFNQCDADIIYVKTNTGSVTGSLLSEKEFITDTDNGKVDVPKTITGGRCEITTDTGNIIISVE